MTEPLLRVRKLSVQYVTRGGAAASAVNGVTFDIEAGEIVGLLGESGCGKTTLALALSGLLPRNARICCGSIRLRGAEVLSQNENQWQRLRGAKISIIFQQPGMALNPVMRAGDQIAEVLRAHFQWNGRKCRQEAASLLKQVGLPDTRFASAYPHELSGGERQRVVIAQALACRPALLVADEPTSALDNTSEAEILSVLKGLKQRFGLALFLITHNPLLLPGLADRALVMCGGGLVEQGTPAELLQEPRHPYTAGLLQSILPLPGSRAAP